MRHIQSVHTDQSFQCNQCCKQFKQKGDVARHIKTVHEGLPVS